MFVVATYSSLSFPVGILGHGPLISEHCHFSQRETAGAPPDRAREQEYNREVTPFPILSETAGAPPDRAREQEYNREVTLSIFLRERPPDRAREQEYNREVTLSTSLRERQLEHRPIVPESSNTTER